MAHQVSLQQSQTYKLIDSSEVTNYYYLPTPFSAASSTLNFISLLVMPILTALVSIFYVNRLLLTKSFFLEGLFPYGVYLLSEAYAFLFELRQTYPGEDMRGFLYLFTTFRFGVLLLIVVLANAIVFFVRKRKADFSRT
ncbi:MAG: hypothetical protein NT003_04795 [Candidatus Magasanikbacteria bacterium]|nr:hypothetical protein [Candidatus Magasanikbacteria bacterium]